MSTANVNDLLRHDPFLRRLARDLLGDPARADDVVQEAWMAAMRGRGAARDLRSWLAGVVRNLTRRARREEQRRARRERGYAVAETVRSTADVVAAEEMRRRVADAVLQLGEPHRTALLLRYYDGLAPREIAARLGVKGSTVRSRLQRGLDLLRGELDRRHDGDRRAWCLALVSFAAGSAKSAPAALLLGGAGVAAVLLAGLFVFHGSRDAPRGRAAPAEHAVEPPRPVREEPPPEAPPPVESGEEPGGVRGNVRGAGGPIADWAFVALVEIHGGVPAERATALAGVEKGTFVLPTLPDGRYMAILFDTHHRPASAVLEVHDGRPLRVPELFPEEGAAITGRVTDAAGIGLQGVEVRARLEEGDGRPIVLPETDLALVRTNRGVEKLVMARWTDREGRYRLAGLAPFRHRVWIEEVAGGAPDMTGTGDGPRFERVVTAPAEGIDFRIPRSTLVIRVRSGEEPLPHANLSVGGLTTSLGEGGGKDLHVRPGIDYELVLRAEGYVTRKVTVTAPENGRRADVAVELDRKEAPATLVVVLAPQGPAPHPPLPERYGFRVGKQERTVPVEDGRCTLTELDPGTLPLFARAEGFWLTRGGFYRDAEIGEVALSSGATTEVVLPLEPAGRLEILVRTADGRTDVPVNAEVSPVGGAPLDVTFLKGDSSGYEFRKGRLPARTGTAMVAEALSPGPYLVRIEWGATTRSTEVRIRAGETTLAEIEITDG